MPRTSGVAIQNNFVKGLVTEATALSFPENACTEASNVIFDSTGRITRRPGIDEEQDATYINVFSPVGQAYVTFPWQAVAGNGNISFYVLQEGDTIRFFNTSTSAELSSNRHSTTFSLSDFLADESDKDPAFYECQFAAGNGDLFVVNAACDSFYITYDVAADDFTATRITLEYRDFEGLEDNLDDDERPAYANIAAMDTANPNHHYNLLNQGWLGTDALTQWDADRADMPSNCDYVGLYRNDISDAYLPNAVTANTPGNRLAPKGHFVLDVARDNRQEVIEDEGFTFNTSSPTFSFIDPSTGTIFTNFTNNTASAFDGVLIVNANNAAYKTSSASGYMGKNFGAADKKTVAEARIFPSDATFLTRGFLDSNNFPLTVTLYGKNSLPASGTDGTVLGSLVIAADSTTGFETITSNDLTTAYQYVWVNMVPTTNDQVLLAEMQIFSGSVSFERPTAVEFYAGRVFYGGIATSTKSNNIYFSQIIEKKDQYGRCFQKNDPSSEAIPDLLPDDGGVIKIPEMGTLKRLFAYQSALLVYASNGIWLVSGSSGANFKADDYVVKRISSIGMNSPQSLCSIKGLPAWWGEDGIYTVTFDPNYDSFTPTSLTLATLDRFYQDIPLLNKKYAKGAYDETEQVAYWIYSSIDPLSSDFYQYDSVLVLDAKSKAFYPWTISAGPLVRSINFVKPATREASSKIKFLHVHSPVGVTYDESFSELKPDQFTDWVDEGNNVDYTSYFITGYRLDGQTQRFFQAPYVFVFLEQETDASCLMQGIFDFTTSGSSGKWSTSQQVFKTPNTFRSVNFRRLKVRGKGRSIQLKFRSETGKPFTIIGWSIWETSNSGL